TFVATFSRLRPCMVVGIALAHSTISIMRPTSARASPSVLPISVVTRRASSSACWVSRSRKEKSQRARSITGVERHAGNAWRAAATPDLQAGVGGCAREEGRDQRELQRGQQDLARRQRGDRLRPPRRVSARVRERQAVTHARPQAQEGAEQAWPAEPVPWPEQ